MTLPAPPAELPADPQLFTLQRDNLLVRFYRPAHGAWSQQRFYGPLSDVRFDHHLPPLGISQQRSIWYAASSLVGAVAEAFGRLGLVDRGEGRRICTARVRSSLVLLDLVGVGPRVFGLDQQIGTSRDYVRCQEWARAFYEAYPEIQGLRWRGREAGSICYALNDRAGVDALALQADYDVAHPAVWPRLVRAARLCRLQIIMLAYSSSSRP